MEFPETMELPDDVKLTVIVESKSSTRYDYGQKRHIKRMCSLNISQELTRSIEDLNQNEVDSEYAKLVEETIEIVKNNIIA